MSNGNPYYVHPGADFGPGLMGLARTVGQVGEIKKKEAAVQEEKTRIGAMKKEAAEVLQTGDPDKISDFLIKNPEMQKAFEGSLDAKDRIINQEIVESNIAVLEGADPVEVLSKDLETLISRGEDPVKIKATLDFLDRLKADPNASALAKRKAATSLAMRAPERWKAYKSAMDPSDKKTSKIINFEYHQKLLKDDPLGATKFADMTDSDSEYSPSPLKKLIGERQVLIDDGTPLDDPIIRAYDAKITGTDVDIEKMTQDEIDTWGAYLNHTGKMPTLGRGKAVAKIRARIVKSAAAQALGAKRFGEEDTEPDKTPAEAALDVIGSQADTRAIQGSLNFLDKQLSAMGSFVANIEMQVDKVAELSKDLKTYDTRLLNVPLRMLRGKILGSSLQAKYDMYLTEIEGEIGKLATGATASVAELSASAQEKWAKIHDKNLSVKDMLSLLEETKEAAKMRKKSVEIQLELARKRMRNRGVVIPEVAETQGAAQGMTTEELMDIAIKGGQ